MNGPYDYDEEALIAEVEAEEEECEDWFDLEDDDRINREEEAGLREEELY
jgi:hypothetical protein